MKNFNKGIFRERRGLGMNSWPTCQEVADSRRWYGVVVWRSATLLRFRTTLSVASRPVLCSMKKHSLCVQGGTQGGSHNFCEVWFLLKSVARVATIVGDHHCHTPRH
ncbi:hypothetical protein TNCV_848271 [Trichonephila clavipes]|uniref:Uncharacterized protein n=1 Tax=Trichonephila clavipes TaxID=2585209 RepID=A0A8X6UWB6_TRICX|nr:hypothetical protein TNCV_848271 [Trichonephila clavipes]